MYNLHIPETPSIPIELSGPDTLLTLNKSMQDAIFYYVIEVNKEHLEALNASFQVLLNSISEPAFEGYRDCLRKCYANIRAMSEWLAGVMKLEREDISTEEFQGLLNCYINVIDAICYDDPYCLGMMTLESSDDAYNYSMDLIVRKIFAASDTLIADVFTPLINELEQKVALHG